MIFEPVRTNDGQRRERERPFGEEAIEFETTFNWDRESRPDAEKRIDAEFADVKERALNRAYGVDEGHDDE